MPQEGQNPRLAAETARRNACPVRLDEVTVWLEAFPARLDAPALRLNESTGAAGAASRAAEGFHWCG